MITPRSAADEVTDNRPGAYADEHAASLTIRHVVLTHPAVLAEMRRWRDGHRGEAVGVATLQGADLSAFIARATSVGALAIASAGQLQEAARLADVVEDASRRSVEATLAAGEATRDAVSDLQARLRDASDQTTRELSAASAATQRELRTHVDSTVQHLRVEIDRLVGGDQPELLAKLAPLLHRFARELDRQTDERTQKLLDRVARQFDPSDSTSPLGRLSQSLRDHNAAMLQRVSDQSEQLTQRLEDLKTTVIAVDEARQAQMAVVRRSAIKGQIFEVAMHQVLGDIAAGMGDEYRPVGDTAGALGSSRKGDGVLIARAGTRIVVELTDSMRKGWGDYFNEAERNRRATASLGITRTIAQNGSHRVRVLAERRVVVAFDPDVDDPDLLRAAVQLLKVAAAAAAPTTRSSDGVVARQKIAAALQELEKLDEINRSVTAIRKGADTIEGTQAGVRTAMHRLLREAGSALGT